MSLKSLNLATRTLKLPGGPMTVRGLSLQEILTLVQTFRPAMTVIFEELSKAHGQEDTPEIASERAKLVIENLFGDAPDFVYSVIVMGCGDSVDDPAAMETARMLDLGSQIALLNAIGEVTFEAGGGAGNVVGLVAQALIKTTSLLPRPTA